ncbi:hypothetical protein HO173_009648 [Letharia columbiana]|uniref:Myb-like domain-containing protein n=1 Tax=Letharia columbiana TaxID=112416 RepID=A0A8H6L1Q8_9LECA|nr:uncharacterized protein HO173_009648 [Letharia columbiana]KAF6232265.1 hypothetical protein HO173_009648 [Letharia columbiana]
MPWDDAREKRLLIEVITITNPAVTRSTWDTIAAVMGDGLTGEACRQKFQSIKRTVKPTNGTTTPDGTTAPKAAKATKPKPSTSSGTATKTRKRKANVNEDDDDDDEGASLFTPMAQKKMKLEKKIDREAEVDGIGAEIFKAEAGGEGIDLECDDSLRRRCLSGGPIDDGRRWATGGLCGNLEAP